MIKKIKNVDINYINYGKSDGNSVILLHGWGQNINMMKAVGDPLSKDYNIVILDLPGFGLSSEPDFPWSVYDYVECINEFLNFLNIKNPTLIGHSFGGKISLAFASIYKVNKLVVFGSPFRKAINKVSIKVKILKSLKKVPLLNKLENIVKKYMGSVDYKNASVIMRDVLVKTVNLDITEDVKKISCPTLIIWGENDEAVNIEDAYILENLIDDSAVIKYNGCGHYAYLERINQTSNILNSFLVGDQK